MIRRGKKNLAFVRMMSGNTATEKKYEAYRIDFIRI